MGSSSTTPVWTVPLSDLLVDDEIVAAARDAIASGWWSMGPRVAEFEQAFAELCGTGHALAVSNGTSALHLALLASGCGPGDEVIVPSLNFVAAANTIRQTGATPVFCDVHGPTDLNLDPADVEAAVTPRTKAVLVLHYGGFPCDMDAVGAVADRHGLFVIEDAAHAPGGAWRGTMCGAIGRVGCFSFFSNKNLAVGEGGMIVTDDDGLAERMRLLRSHGMTTLTWDRHRGHASTYDVAEPGFNYRMDEVHAAIALVQLERLPATNAARARLAERYREQLDGTDDLIVPFGETSEHAVPTHHLVVVVLPQKAGRREVQERMKARGIQTSVHYPPIHEFSAYSRDASRALPGTDAIAQRILTLPLYPHLEEAQVDAVCESLIDALSASPGSTG